MVGRPMAVLLPAVMPPKIPRPRRALGRAKRPQRVAVAAEAAATLVLAAVAAASGRRALGPMQKKFHIIEKLMKRFPVIPPGIIKTSQNFARWYVLILAKTVC